MLLWLSGGRVYSPEKRFLKWKRWWQVSSQPLPVLLPLPGPQASRTPQFTPPSQKRFCRHHERSDRGSKRSRPSQDAKCIMNRSFMPLNHTGPLLGSRVFPHSISFAASFLFSSLDVLIHSIWMAKFEQTSNGPGKGAEQLEFSVPETGVQNGPAFLENGSATLRVWLKRNDNMFLWTSAHEYREWIYSYSPVLKTTQRSFTYWMVKQAVVTTYKWNRTNDCCIPWCGWDTVQHSKWWLCDCKHFLRFIELDTKKGKFCSL